MSSVVGMLPEFVAKWITGNGIPVSMLCMTQEPPNTQSEGSLEEGEEGASQDDKKVECLNPLVGESAFNVNVHRRFYLNSYGFVAPDVARQNHSQGQINGNIYSIKLRDCVVTKSCAILELHKMQINK